MAWVKNSYIAWSLSGVLLGIGLIYTPVWILGLVGGIWFLVLLQQSKSLKKSLLGAWLSWTIKSLFTLWWIMSVYPIEWLPEEMSSGQFGIILICWLTSAMSIGLGGMGVVLLYELAKKAFIKISWSKHILIAGCWLGGEILGSLAYSALSFGPGGGLNIAFGFGYGGYLLAEHELMIKLSSLAGVYGLSLLYGLLISVSASWIFIKSLRVYVFLLLAVVFLTSFINFQSLVTANHRSDSHAIAIIETDFPSAMFRNVEGKAEVANKLEEAMAAVLQLDMDYVILPEGMGYFEPEAAPLATKSMFRFVNNDPQEIIIDSGRASENDGFVVQASIYNGLKNTMSQAHKSYLVPQGEYISYVFLGIAKALGYSENVKMLDEHMSYRVGSKTSQAGLSEDVPAILFCLESVSPFAVRQLLRERDNIPFVAHPISHGWFNEPRTLWHQQELMLRVQAIWNDVYVVSAANQAISTIYDPNGSVSVGKVVVEGGDWRIREVNIPH